MKKIFTFLFVSLISIIGFSQSNGFNVKKTQLADNYVLVTVTGPIDNYATYLCKGNIDEVNAAVFESGELILNHNTRDHFEENIDLGLLPSDILYFDDDINENMVVYGGNKLKILDGDYHKVTEVQFEIDTKVSLHNMAFMPVAPNNQVHLIKNSREEGSFIICAGEGGGLKIIESLPLEPPNNFSVFQNFQDEEEGQLLSTSVYAYCDTSFYWVLNYWSGKCKVKKYFWNKETQLYCFDIEHQLIFNNDEIVFFQTKATPGNLRIALLNSVLEINPINLSVDKQYEGLSVDNIQHYYGHIKDEQKIYSFIDDQIIFTDENMITWSTSGSYDWQSNIAYFTGYCDKQIEPDYFEVVNFRNYEPGIYNNFLLDGAMDVKSNTSFLILPDESYQVAVGNNKIIGFDEEGNQICYDNLLCHYGYKIAFDDNPACSNDRIGITVACLIDGLLVQREGYSCTASMSSKIVETGISSSITCFNEQDENAYFFYNGDGGSNYFIKYNGNTTDLVTIDPNNPQSFSVGDCIYNDKSNLILTSLNDKCVDDFKLLKIVNGGIPNVLSGSYENISCFTNFDEFIYFYSKTAFHTINKVWMDGTTFHHDVISVNYAINALDINKEDHYIYGTYVLDDLYGKVVRINHNNLNDVLDFYIDGNNPIDISYLVGLDKIYIAQYNGGIIEIYDTEFNQQIPSIIINGHPKKIEFNPYQKQAFIVSDVADEPGFTKITIIDCIGDQVLEEKLIRRSDGYIYDTINDQFYFHTNYPALNDDGELEYNIKALNCFNNNFSNQVKTNLYSYSDIFLSKSRTVPSKPSYNYEDNYIYIGNYGSATATKIKPYDEKFTFRPGWTWLSYPRLERYNDEPFDAITLLERINPWFPTYLYQEYGPVNYPLKYINYVLGIGWDLSGGLTEVKSSMGYKLYYQKNTPSFSIRLEGAKLNDDTPINLMVGENWIGYFLDKSQYPEQCLPAGLWEALLQIKTQYWSMTKINTDPPYWFLQGKKAPFKYGDLIILKTSHPYPNFKWQNQSTGTNDMEVPQTTYYTFYEQSDYLPFYIETDSSSEIMEIALLADGTVRGAAVCGPGDTLVEVRGYLQGVAPGTLVEFETWNGYKSEPVEKGNYVVIDHHRNVREKRNIYTGEKAYYYHVSLKSRDVYEIPPAIGIVACQPNPFSQSVEFSFKLNKTVDLSIQIFDIQGNFIRTILNGYYPEGYYNLTWEGDNDSGKRIMPGVYFYKVSIGNETLQTDKIVMIK